jgi:hypothetical protein
LKKRLPAIVLFRVVTGEGRFRRVGFTGEKGYTGEKHGRAERFIF